MIDVARPSYVTPSMWDGIDPPMFDGPTIAIVETMGFDTLTFSAALDATAPAERALILAGYDPIAATWIDTATPESALRIDYALRQIETVDFTDRSGELDPATSVAVIVEFYPVWSPDVWYAMELPEHGDSFRCETWDSTPESVEEMYRREPCRLVLRSFEPLVSPGAFASALLPAADAFAGAIGGLLGAAWDPADDWKTFGKGISWSINPASWWDDEEEVQGPARALRRLGEKAYRALTETSDRAAFFSGLAIGETTESVLLQALGKRVGARSRARGFRRAALRAMEDQGRALMPTWLDVGFERQPWLEVLLLLHHEGVLMTRGLPDGNWYGVVGATESPRTEPLVAEQVDDDTIVLNLAGSAWVTLTRSQAFSPPIPLERSFAWELTPPHPETGVSTLIVVAGPGVTVEVEDLGLPNRVVELVRVQDREQIPSWSKPIPIMSLLEAHSDVFLPTHHPSEGVGWIAPDPAPTFVVTPSHHGARLSYFETPEAKGSPNVELEIELSDPLSGSQGFRYQFDFLAVRPEGVALAKVRPRLCLWITEDVRISGSYVTFPNLEIHVFRGSLTTIFDDAFDSLPVPSIDGEVWSFAYTEVDGERSWELPDFWESERFTAAGLEAVPLRDLSEVENRWSVIDWFLLVIDVVIGFIPIVGDAVDIGEFLLAAATGYDRWGRPVSELDLLFMGIGAAIPLASSGAVRAIGDVVAPPAVRLFADGTPRPFNPVSSGVGPDEAKELVGEVDDAVVDARRTMEEGGDVDAAAEAVATKAEPMLAAMPLLRTAAREGDPGRTVLELGDLLNDEGDQFLIPALAHAYRKWRGRTKSADKSPAGFLQAQKSSNHSTPVRKMLEHLLGSEFWRASASAAAAKPRKRGALWPIFDERGFRFGPGKMNAGELAARIRSGWVAGIPGVSAEDLPLAMKVLEDLNGGNSVATMTEEAVAKLIGRRQPTPENLGTLLQIGIDLMKREAAAMDVDPAELVEIEGIHTFFSALVTRSGYEHGAVFELTGLAYLLREGYPPSLLRLQLPMTDGKQGPDAVAYLSGAAELIQKKAFKDPARLLSTSPSAVLLHQAMSDFARLSKQRWKVAASGAAAGDESVDFTGRYTMMIDFDRVFVDDASPIRFVQRMIESAGLADEFPSLMRGDDLVVDEAGETVQGFDVYADDFWEAAQQIGEGLAGQLDGAFRALRDGAPIDPATLSGLLDVRLEDINRRLAKNGKPPIVVETDATRLDLDALVRLEVFGSEEATAFVGSSSEELMRAVMLRLAGFTEETIKGMPDPDFQVILVTREVLS